MSFRPMSSRPIRHALEYAVFRAVRGAITALPHAAVRRLGRGVGRFAYHAAVPFRRLALANMALALPHLDRAEHRRLTRLCFANMGAYFFELVSSFRFTPEDIAQRYDFEGEEILERLDAAGQGYFILSGHFGSWELAVYPVALRVKKLHTVIRPPNNPWVERDMRRMRESFGIHVIDKKGAGNRMRGALRDGGQVAIVIDQHVHKNVGIQVPFMGHPASTSPMVALLSQRLQIPAVPILCVPAPGGRYHVSVREPIWPEGKSKEARFELTRRYVEVIENEIYAQPEHWLWMHRRWRD